VAIASLVVSAARPIFAESETLPAIERCQQFCGRVYGEGSEEHHECAAACTEADACHQRCKQKFGAEAGKVRSCLRRCMSRHDEAPPEPPPPGNPPVQL
jgi:hypothetical protein